VGTADEFVDFAQAVLPRLRRTAFLLCGDWHTAEDLTQTALANVFASWRRIRHPDAADAYALRTLVNTYLAERRLKRVAEILTTNLPEHPTEPLMPEMRMVVLDALASLPPRARAVVVLRYWQDLSVEQVAIALGCSPGTVKSQSARSLRKLRVLLGDDLTGSGDGDRSVHVRRDTKGSGDG
jgi:RNA polymerase sigma-70 factor (sigma-E family)